MMPDEMEEIIADFITEAEEFLDKIDPLFVKLEAKGHDSDILNDIFRSMHTIKGAAGFLGFQSIVDVAHGAENILKKLREGEISITKQLMDVILKSVDILRLLLQHIKLKDEKEEDTVPLLKELDEALKNAQFPVPPNTPPASPTPPFTKGGQGGLTEQPATNEKLICPQFITGHENQDSRDGCLTTMENKLPPVGQASRLSKEVFSEQSLQREAPASSEPDKVVPEKKDAIQTLRVDINRIDKVMDLTGEVVLVRNRLLNIVNYLELKYSADPYVESLFETVSFLDLVTSDMQLAVMRMRMQPIKKVFSKFPRLVRDISSNLGKNVNLRISGEDTEVDKSVIEHIGDPLIHIIRNAIDHALESTEERLSKGKTEKGAIAISAYQKGNQIVIEVYDDGRGIDIERVKRKAIERALITEDEAIRMTDEAAINLIFLPGFSTAEVATELSGRGVGMDVVKTNISKLNGYVEVTTKKDIGTTFRISIPLTLAIIQALTVCTSGSHYAIPLTSVEETLKVSKKDITDVVGQKVLVIRGRVLPIFELSDILGNGKPTDSQYRYAVVIAIGEKKFCIAVDELLGQEEIVIKTVEGIDTDSTSVLGATITGDGRVILILDLAGISRNMLGSIKV